jgi:predicted ATP-dependent endonuclease of OLD family
MKVVKKIKLHNFKRFADIEIPFDDQLNVLVGDNECGKSTILLALDLVLSGSRSKVETLGLQSLLNSGAVSEFLAGEKTIDKLPKLWIEVYLNEQGEFDLNGKNHSDEGKACDGLKMLCEPKSELGAVLHDILSQPEPNFPFEFYDVKFNTFADQPHSPYKKYLRHLLIDNSQINNEYATREYIKAVYDASVKDAAEQSKNENEYRRHKTRFTNDVLKNVNESLPEYSFSIRTSTKANLETDLTITEGTIPIENRGSGRRCFIKTEFAIRKGKVGSGLDVLLLEEPENHLSHLHMNRLIQQIAKATTKQLFIATHSNLISARLDLRKAILLNSGSHARMLLSDLSEGTAKFFMKAPDCNILQFVLSGRVLLVEGDAEFILMEEFYRTITGEELATANTHVISVDGTSFKRYFDLAKLLGVRTAAIRDNDGNPQHSCIDNYSDYKDESNIHVFFEPDPNKKTFEICLYEGNKTVCDDLFLAGRKTLSVLDYMLQNKADAAFQLLDKKAGQIVVPSYIRNAIEWIRK